MEADKFTNTLGQAEFKLDTHKIQTGYERERQQQCTLGHI